MEKKQKDLLIGVGMIAIGIFIGWAFTARNYGAGPLAGLQGTPSSANLQGSAGHRPGDLCYFDSSGAAGTLGEDMRCHRRVNGRDYWTENWSSTPGGTGN